tara:strand:+ start:2404 stop:2763 length:360 start_codon:yes stop_codon:yes gene_type:complete
MLRTILALVIVALLQPTAALRMPVHAVQQRAGRTLQPQMALPSMKDAEALSDEELNKEITTAQKARRSAAPPLFGVRSLRTDSPGLSDPMGACTLTFPNKWTAAWPRDFLHSALVAPSK